MYLKMIEKKNLLIYVPVINKLQNITKNLLIHMSDINKLKIMKFEFKKKTI